MERIVTSSAGGLPIAASVSNLRDLGGARTADGRVVAHGLLFRSSHFGELSADDASALAPLGLRTVVDLRGRDERTQLPTRLASDGLTHVHLPIEPGAMGAIRQHREAGTLDEAAVLEVMQAIYGRFVHKHHRVFADFLALLLDARSYPLVFHCTAGKDRTGFAAALTLLALDVPREAVMADYMASSGRWQPEAGSDWALLSQVKTAYLQAALDAIDAEWGSPWAYMEAQLGVGAAERQALADRLLRRAA